MNFYSGILLIPISPFQQHHHQHQRVLRLRQLRRLRVLRVQVQPPLQPVVQRVRQLPHQHQPLRQPQAVLLPRQVPQPRVLRQQQVHQQQQVLPQQQPVQQPLPQLPVHQRQLLLQQALQRQVQVVRQQQHLNMCSIAGTKNNIEEMIEIMKYRAPDDKGFFRDKKFKIGMGRLSIIDLKSDNLCPYKEDNFVLSFNGEIYNYIELRNELKTLGHTFKTNSDTEVLLKSYKQWGIKCLNEFNGMFAFAIYDGKRIFMARDIAGEKPLYYTDPFQFSSEAKVFKKCKEFPPAHYGIYDFKTLKIKRYWNFPKRHIDLRHAEEELEWLLEDSVKLRTRSDVPYALYYSGGIDSSLISTFHNFQKFTYKGNKKEFLKDAKKIYYHLDYPVKSFSPYGLWSLAKQASKKVKVVISGEGADELFGGYVRYVKPEFNYQAQKKFPSYKMFEPAKSVQESCKEEFNGNMQELLRMGDRMSSAFGLENRCPFLDKRIIEFAFSLPNELKINGTETKVILRRILEKRMPNYKDIEKKGLYIPVNKWIGSKELYEKNDYLKWQKTL